MATLADYPDDWEDTFLSNPNFSVVEYTRRMSEYQRLLKEQKDAEQAASVEGGVDQDADWADKQHEAMYPGHRAAANKAGFYGFMGPNAATRFNPRYADYHDKLKQGILDVLPNGFTHKNEQGELTGKYSSQDYKDYLDSKQGYMASQDESTTNTNTPSYDVAAGYKSYDDAMNQAAKRTALAGGVPWGSDYANRIGALSTQNNSWNNIAPSIHANLTGMPDLANIATAPTIVNDNTGSVWGDYMDEAAGGGGIIEAMIAAGADPNDPFGDPTGFM